MANEKRSVFLYSEPTFIKKKNFIHTQNEYTNLINYFIKKMAYDLNYSLDLLNNNKQSPKIRLLEKNSRSSHVLGSAYGQNAIDHAVKELHNHYIRIRNKLYGFIQEKIPQLEPYVSFISIFNASICDADELIILNSLIEKGKKAKKPDLEKIESYEMVKAELTSLTEEQRSSNRAFVKEMFLEKLHYWKLPYVKEAPIQLDSRVSTMEVSHSTKEHFVIYIKLLNSNSRVAFPVSTSQNGLRRLKQYKNCSMSAMLIGEKIRFALPIEKKIKLKKIKQTIGIDMGITDLFYTSEGKNYGTFSGMINEYEGLVEKKLGKRSSLRNKKRDYQRRLKKSDNEYEKQWLRLKIKNISEQLNQNKRLKKQKRKYQHMVDVEISKAAKGLFNDIKKHQYLSVFEDLDISEFDRGKKANKRDSFWIRGQLFKKITGLLDWNGFTYHTIDPAYTSKMCPKCYNVDDNNRKGKKFVCTVCKHSDDADQNASINIRERLNDEEITQIVEKYRYTTKKRHKKIKELLAKRHCSYKVMAA